ncbi:GATA zinc finger domain-containing protein 14, partial [Hyalella azteca]|uniref:GATA zinc finger domain-containing protein 14 n=1 Tax=Hyalella azteca TaxID=294128 RepID=A0A8B7P026_HYAAZ
MCQKSLSSSPNNNNNYLSDINNSNKGRHSNLNISSSNKNKSNNKLGPSSLRFRRAKSGVDGGNGNCIQDTSIHASRHEERLGKREAPHDLFDLIRKVQDSRIDDQRCELPNFFTQATRAGNLREGGMGKSPSSEGSDRDGAPANKSSRQQLLNILRNPGPYPQVVLPASGGYWLDSGEPENHQFDSSSASTSSSTSSTQPCRYHPNNPTYIPSQCLPPSTNYHNGHNFDIPPTNNQSNNPSNNFNSQYASNYSYNGYHSSTPSEVSYESSQYSDHTTVSQTSQFIYGANGQYVNNNDNAHHNQHNKNESQHHSANINDNVYDNEHRNGRQHKHQNSSSSCLQHLPTATSTSNANIKIESDETAQIYRRHFMGK